MMRPIVFLLVLVLSFSALAQPTLDGNGITGAIGELITIGGTNFVNSGMIVVKFQNAAGGPTDAPGTFMSATQISVVVPSKAGSGNATVNFNGIAATGTVFFTAKAPELFGFFPQIITVGSPFLVQGRYFDALAENNEFGAHVITVCGVTANLTNYRVKGSIEEGAELTIVVPDPGVAHPLPLLGDIIIALRNGTQQSTGPMTIVKNPVIDSNGSISTVASGADYQITANFTLRGIDAQKVKAHVKYRSITKGPSEPYTKLDLNVSEVQSATFDKFIMNGTIPKAAIGELGIEYRLQVFPDNTFSVMNTDSLQSIIAKVQHIDGISFAYTPGSSQTAYRIISTPLVMTNNLVNQNFTDYKNTVCRMFRLIPGSATFSELAGADALEPGIGYWFIYNGGKPTGLQPGTSVDASNDNPFPIELTPGWNMIGNPYNFAISWADVLAANPTVPGLSPDIRVYRGSSANVDILNPVEGGFISNTGDTPVIIKIPAKRSTSGGRVGSLALRNSIEQPEFEIMFKIAVADQSYDLGGLGMNPNASEGVDKFDTYNIPHFLDYIEMKYSRIVNNMTVTKDVVTTAENHTWDFEVVSNLDDKNTTLSWDNTYFGNAKEIVLLDVATFRAVNMTQESNYRFHRGVSGRFKVIYGSHEYVQAQLTPDRLTISDPYPNPFNGKIKIDFAVPPRGGDGTVEVLDVTGNRISSLPAIAESGIYHWEWDSEGRAPGMYFVKVSVGNERVIRKIIKQ